MPSSSSTSTSKPKRRRAYIGNLRSRPNLAASLYNNLFIPYSLPVRNFPNTTGANANNDDDDNGASSIGISITTPKNPSHSSVYALVEFTDVEYAIQVLDGVMFDGRTLRVSKEKTNFASGGGGGRGGGGFGSSRWAGSGGGGGWSGGGGSRSKNSFDRDGGNNYKSQQQQQTSSTHQQARVQRIPPSKNTAELSCINKSEIKDSPNEVNAATIAGITLDFQSRCKLPLSELLTEYGEEDPDWKKPQKKQQPNNKQAQQQNDDGVVKNDTVDFQSRCDMPLSELMAEYGQQDVDWKKHQHQPNINIPSASSSSAQGQGVVNHIQSMNTEKQQTHQHQQSNSRGKSDNNNNNNDTSNDSPNSMLAHFAKAPIHLELLSFGYKYGAPSYSKRGFSYAHPIPPVDVRDLDRAPGHVAKFTGLSYLVKRALLNPTTATTTKGNVYTADDSTEQPQQQQQPGGAKEEEGGDDNTTGGPKELSPMRQRANEIADEIIKVLVESIDEGGHGPISPLTMTISIGSEYGRHRGVVLVEHLAVVLRARLRRNDGREFNDETAAEDDDGRPGKNGIVKQPVSVGTRHLHVEARHTDEEAFGQDLKREARKAEKMARRRQQFDDSGWDESW